MYEHHHLRLSINFAMEEIKQSSLVDTIRYNLTALDLTFKKWFVSFYDEYNCKTDLKCRPPWLGDEENFSLKIE